MTNDQQVPLGVFGGSGFYEFLDDAVEIVVDTPFGAPAGPVVVGSVAGNPVAFMARHGRNHQSVIRVKSDANVQNLSAAASMNFLGMTEQSAQGACAALSERRVTCMVIRPQE